jgi:dTMP kinase
MARGAVVLSDRFDLSTMAYQVAGRGLPESDVRRANAVATGGLVPDRTLVIDLAPDTARARRQATGAALDRMEQGDAAMQERVARCFADATGPGVVHLDGMLGAEALAEAAWGHVREMLTEHVPTGPG